MFFLLNNQSLDIFTFMETYRPQNLKIYVTINVESYFLVEEALLLHTDLLFWKNVPCEIDLFKRS